LTESAPTASDTPSLHDALPISAVGADADLALLERGEHVLRAADLRYRHRLSPYAGRTLPARIVRTLLRGREAYPEPRAQPRLLTDRKSTRLTPVTRSSRMPSSA